MTDYYDVILLLISYRMSLFTPLKGFLVASKQHATGFPFFYLRPADPKRTSFCH